MNVMLMGKREVGTSHGNFIGWISVPTMFYWVEKAGEVKALTSVEHKRRANKQRARARARFKGEHKIISWCNFVS